MSNVLLVDDEVQIRRALRNAFTEEGVHIIEATDGATAIEMAAASMPDLIVLDLGLPDLDGFSVCRTVRQWSDVPILIVSARHSDQEMVRLLDAGADDYVTKPFNTNVVIARARALLRRVRIGHGLPETRIKAADGLEIDVLKRTVRRGERDIHLTPTEWALLKVFLAREGSTLTHQQIFDAVWPRSTSDAQQLLRVHMASLRRKIELDAARPRFILTEPGVGYRCQIQ